MLDTSFLFLSLSFSRNNELLNISYCSDSKYLWKAIFEKLQTCIGLSLTKICNENVLRSFLFPSDAGSIIDARASKQSVSSPGSLGGGKKGRENRFSFFFSLPSVHV